MGTMAELDIVRFGDRTYRPVRVLIERAIWELERGAEHSRHGMYLTGGKALDVATSLFEEAARLSCETTMEAILATLRERIAYHRDSETRESLDNYHHNAEVHAMIVAVLVALEGNPIFDGVGVEGEG